MKKVRCRGGGRDSVLYRYFTSEKYTLSQKDEMDGFLSVALESPPRKQRAWIRVGE